MRLRLYLQRRFAGHQRDRFLLRILGIYLNNRQVRSARSDPFHHNPHDCPSAANSRRIRLPRRGNYRLPMFFVVVRYDGDLLRSTRQKPAVLHFYDADYRRVVLQQIRNRKQIVHILDHDSNRLLLSNLK